MFPFLLRFSFFSAICKVSSDNHFAFLYFFFLGLIRVVSSACAVLCLVSQPCPTLCDPVDCSLPSSSVHAYSPSKNNELVCQALLQGIFPTQGSNPGLPHCRWVFYRLSHQWSLWILEWVTYLFSRGSSWPKNLTKVSYIAVWFFSSWSSAYLRLLVSLPAVLIPACDSSSPAFHMMSSAYKLNKQDDNIQLKYIEVVLSQFWTSLVFLIWF